MAESKTKVQFIVEARAVDEIKKDGSWLPYPTKFTSLYEAIRVRESLDQMNRDRAAGKEKSDLISGLLIELIRAQGAKNLGMETRVTKRTLTYSYVDEVVDEASTVKV